MGDYTKSGAKIGTCGNAYYATYEMVAKEALTKNDPECRYYALPKNGCTFAFPFPEHDGKAIGDISSFHEDQWVRFYFQFPAGTGCHKTMAFHSHPDGCHGVNIFAPCPQDRDAPAGSVSRNMPDYDTYRLYGQTFVDGNLHIVGECPYCKTLNTFSKEESAKVVANIKSRTYKDWDHQLGEYVLNTKRRDYDLEVVKRIEATYRWAQMEESK